MALDKIFIRIVISLLVILVLGEALHYVSYSDDPLKEGLKFITGYICIVCLGFGLGLILLYDKWSQPESKKGFFYCFIATLNTAAGFAGFYALFAGILNVLGGIIISLIPLVIGISMFRFLFTTRKGHRAHIITLPK